MAENLDRAIVFIMRVRFAIRFLLFSLLSAIAPSIFRASAVNPPSKLNAIMITGASTGIGHSAAMHLVKAGYLVFAGVRKQEDADRLRLEVAAQKWLGDLVPVIIDVTDESSIAKCVETVRRNLSNGARLTALVNNAGVALGLPIEVVHDELFRRVFQVNVRGLILCTQAFLPLLREAQGSSCTPRIVNLGSIAGDQVMAGNVIYSCSKFCVDALSRGLRLELDDDVAGTRISVSNVKPGAIRSAIWTKIKDDSASIGSALTKGQREIMQSRYKHLDFSDKGELLSSMSADPILTSVAIEHAVSAKFPQTSYLVGLDAFMLTVIGYLPDEITDYIKKAAQKSMLNTYYEGKKVK